MTIENIGWTARPGRAIIAGMTDAADPSRLSNGGPPLDDDPRPWGSNGIGYYFEWEAARKAAFDAPWAIAMMRARRAQALGLTYEEYTLEIIERGRFLNAGDTDRIAAILRRRPLP